MPSSTTIIRQGKGPRHLHVPLLRRRTLTRKADIIKLCEEHSDCQFLAFTNGTLIDTDFAREMLRVKNFIPAISIEGFEAATDARRGKGYLSGRHGRHVQAQGHRLPFGVSCCYTSQNIDSPQLGGVHRPRHRLRRKVRLVLPLHARGRGRRHGAAAQPQQRRHV